MIRASACAVAARGSSAMASRCSFAPRRGDWGYRCRMTEAESVAPGRVRCRHHGGAVGAPREHPGAKVPTPPLVPTTGGAFGRSVRRRLDLDDLLGLDPHADQLVAG